MLTTGNILFIAFGYLGILFAIAYYGDHRADKNQSIISNPYIYALSLAVYCTAWTFYGSVGFAAKSGIGFLPIYIGPTLMAALGLIVLRKIIRISRIHHITSIADFIASRYGKSMSLGVSVAVIAVLGVIPYISLQLKAISHSLLIMTKYPQVGLADNYMHAPVYMDTAFYTSIMLAVFAILFGTRHLDATERHEGMVAAIAFESIVKLAAFLTAGIFVTYFVYDGFGELAASAARSAELRRLFVLSADTGGLGYTDWSAYLLISMMAVIFLPRQFQVAVVENVDERHLNRAVWLFPLYLFAINIFVLPIALGGKLHFSGLEMDADFYALLLPLAKGEKILALFVFIGGMSAATGMVIVETIALSTMISNEIVIPSLVRLQFRFEDRRSDLSQYILGIRRLSIVLVLLLGYAYFRLVGEYYTLVSIGLTSFTAIAQFSPAILGGIFWKGGTRAGALWGLISGFLVWGYTLILPSLAQTGIISGQFISEGLFGIALLKPFELFGLQGFNHISNTVFWSLLANVGMYVGVSMFTAQSAVEHTQATLFVDVFRFSGETEDAFLWRGTAFIPDLKSLLGAVLGEQKAETVIGEYVRKQGIDIDKEPKADPGMVLHAEKVLAGVIGTTAAHVMVASVVKEEPLGVQEVMEIIDGTRQAIAYSRELEKATTELQAANEQLKALDNMKDEFIATVTHELRTPLTAVRALAGILHDTPGLDKAQRTKFSGVIIQEGERLTRLINQVLDFQKIESGKIEMEMASVDLREVIHDALESMKQVIDEKNSQVELDLAPDVPMVRGDRDRLLQVVLNLISNAVKFCDREAGRVGIRLYSSNSWVRVDVADNGDGISKDHLEDVFERFWQDTQMSKGKVAGSGLGLAIAKQIIDRHSGKIWVESDVGKGAVFSFVLPGKMAR